MSKTHLVIPDTHCYPGYSNERAFWLGELIADVKPDVVINIGDHWDFPSLSSYDKGKGSFRGRTYKADLDIGLDFQDKTWSRVKKRKKRQPKKVFIKGNHEHRQFRAVDMQPELDGVISPSDLQLEKYYDKVVEYEGGTPGVVCIDGINYSHYFVSGIMGRPIGGEHPATSLLTKQFDSCTQGHTHVVDFSERTKADGKKIMGMHVGCFQDYESPWAGEINKLWWRGVVIKRGVEDGCYDPEMISLNRLKKIYGKTKY